MTSTNTLLALGFLAACVTVVVHSHHTGFQIKLQNNSLNETFNPYSSCLSKLNRRQKAEFENKQGVNNKSYHWPGGIMYYTYRIDLSLSERNTIEKGMKLITNRTCIKFIPRTIQRNYVYFVKDVNKACYSSIGMQGGPQVIGLHPFGCIYPWVAATQLIHALGFFDEHNRNDRDDYITVDFNNIAEEYWGSFKKIADTETYGVPYNVRSLMHLPAYIPGISIKSNKPIMVSKNKSDPIPASSDKRHDLTNTDADKINAMYRNECIF